MIKHILSILILFMITAIPLSIQAQNGRKQKKDDGFTQSRKMLEPIPFHFSAIGSLKFYGLKFGIDYPFKMVEKRGFMNSTRGEKTIIERYMSADVGIWHYNGVYENVFFSTEGTFRFINSRGYFFQISPVGVGIHYVLSSFINNTSATDTILTTGKFYVTPSVSLGVGRDFAFRRGSRAKPLVMFFKGGVSSMFPYKKYGYIFPHAEAGLAVRFNSIRVFVKKERRD